MHFKLLTVFLLLSLSSVLSAPAETLNLSIAASMTDAFKEIIVSFSKNHSEAEIHPNFASSGSLAKQILQGAPADVYVSANPKWMKYLKENSMIAAGSDRIFAFNTLVVIGNANLTITALEDLKNLHRIAIGSPKSVPAGQYAKQAMDTSGIYQELASQKKLVMAKDVRQALLYADRGEVDAAFVYKTDALLARNTKILYAVPDTLYDQVAYPIGLTQTGAEKKLAKQFISFMDSNAVSEILATHGFQKPSNP